MPIRRCRPLLGTFVEIEATARTESLALEGVEAAFGAVSRVQRLMSFHDEASDVARLNANAAERDVEIDPWTFEVLRAAVDLHARSRGAVDVSVAPLLQRWGFLPAFGDETRPAAVDQSAIELRPGHRVRFRRAVRIDLGGIAKGFAVDRAIDALRGAGVASASVNAGGDLRVFGVASTVHVRHPRMPGRMLPLLRIDDGAVATSASYFSKRRCNGRWVSPLVDPQRGRSCATTSSVTVHASSCLAADALTKVLAILGARSAPILRAHSARGYLVTRAGVAVAGESAA